MPAASTDHGDRTPGGDLPLWAGPVCALVGLAILVFARPAPSVNLWVARAGAGFIVCLGLLFTFLSLGYRRTGAFFGGLAAVAFLAVFHWAAFGPGERTGKGSGSIGPLRIGQLGGTRSWFIVFTLILDALLVLGLFKAWRRRNPEKP